ncbi:MAG: GTP-binding protein [Myxococcota bacterium]
MPDVDFAKRSMVCKIVYYGPGLGGKTTNLKYLHQSLPANVRGQLMSLQTESERTLFFDFFPAALGKVGMYDIRIHFFSVPGQSFYNATRKSLLRNVDGVVFVADSAENRLDANLDSLDNLQDNLAALNRTLISIPHVIQYNKRDLPRALPLDELREQLNPHKAPDFEAIASKGEGVFETQRQIVKNVLVRVQSLVKER